MKTTTLLLLLVAFTFLPSFKNEEKIVNTTNAVTAVPLYRLLDPYGYHFYTSNEAEKNSVIRDLGMVYEDIIGYIFPQQVAGTVPLFRYRSLVSFWPEYNSDTYTQTALHFYTTNQNDEELTAPRFNQKDGGKNFYSSPYVSEGIQGYISTTQVAGATTIYRVKKRSFFMNDGDNFKSLPGGWDWFYTNNEAEKYSAINKYGYAEKGIAGYMWTSAITK